MESVLVYDTSSDSEDGSIVTDSQRPVKLLNPLLEEESSRSIQVANGKASNDASIKWIRSVPHVAGNWASHVYIKVHSTLQLKDMAERCALLFRESSSLWQAHHAPKHKKENTNDHSQFQRENNNKKKRKINSDQFKHAQRVKNDVNMSSNMTFTSKSHDNTASPSESKCRRIKPGDLLMHDLSPGSYQHLSISKNFYLKEQHIEPFQNHLQEAFQGFPRFTVEVAEDCQVLVNEERTRSFLALQVCGGAGVLRELVAAADPVLRRYGAPPYYENPNFHVSICSALGDYSSANKEIKSRVSEEDEVSIITFEVTEIECKIGNKLMQISLL
mmetsp:Transcript_8406/g.14843  ORF Transcript_8406/g.14843 Transcript_8406/m.14843 type:complete len:330 (+) Transcript_8406:121-1110(+)